MMLGSGIVNLMNWDGSVNNFGLDYFFFDYRLNMFVDVWRNEQLINLFFDLHR